MASNPGITIIENDVKSFQNPMEAEMQKAIKFYEGELIKIRTGRAHTSLVEDVTFVGYTNMPMSIKQAAVISAPEPRLIVIQPWDASLIEAIEKGITNSDVGLTPVNDGKLIRLQLPEMSTSRRDELVKLLHKKSNDAKERVRDVRKEFNNLLRDSKKDKKISENFFSRLEDVLQKVTDKFTAQIDQMMQKKEKDIKTV
jgi:ribosome recycling factor